MDIQFPPFLQKDDKVVIVSPSSKIDKLFLKGAKKRLESWGLKVAMGKHAGGSSGRFAGTVKQRLDDLHVFDTLHRIYARLPVWCST